MARKKKARPQRQPTLSKSYPPPAMREQIIVRRDQILQELIHIFASMPEQKHLLEVQKLGARYGMREVVLVLDAFQKSNQRELITEDAFLYRDYRQAFARFGATRPFLNREEYEALVYEHGVLLAKRKFVTLVENEPSARERELRDLLLLDSRYWKDLFPPAIPPRPVDFKAPSLRTYGPPEQALLTWGWDLDEERIDQEAKNHSIWLPAIPKLVEMTLDEGLLGGWPGEQASWAPHHAVHLLGYLQAHRYAGDLLDLLARPNDWLGDQLPVVWARMGPAAEPVLWSYLRDAAHPPRDRAVAARALQGIAEAHHELRPVVVAGLIQWLDQSSAEDATINAYVIHILERMRAVEAAGAVGRAFQQNKVDRKITAPFDFATAVQV